MRYGYSMYCRIPPIPQTHVGLKVSLKDSILPDSFKLWIVYVVDRAPSALSYSTRQEEQQGRKNGDMMMRTHAMNRLSVPIIVASTRKYAPVHDVMMPLGVPNEAATTTTSD